MISPDICFEYKDLKVWRVGFRMKHVLYRVAVRPRNLARLQRLVDAWAAEHACVAGSVSVHDASPIRPPFVVWKATEAGHGVTRETIDGLKGQYLRVIVPAPARL